MCPTEAQNGTISISCRHQDAVIALGIYLLESKLQHKEKIITYLLHLVKLLEKATWTDEMKYNPSDSMLLLLKGCFSIIYVEICRNTHG